MLPKGSLIPLLGAAVVAFTLTAPVQAQHHHAPQPYPQLVGGTQALADALRFPETARRDGREGVVVLDVMVNARGDVHDARIRQSAGADFDEAALAAIRGMRFTPAHMYGEPVAAQMLIPVRFSQPRTAYGRSAAPPQAAPTHRYRISSPPPRPTNTEFVRTQTRHEPARRYQDAPPRRTHSVRYSPSREAQPQPIRQQPVYREVPMRRSPHGRFRTEAVAPTISEAPAASPQPAPERRTPHGRFQAEASEPAVVYQRVPERRAPSGRFEEPATIAQPVEAHTHSEVFAPAPAEPGRTSPQALTWSTRTERPILAQPRTEREVVFIPQPTPMDREVVVEPQAPERQAAPPPPPPPAPEPLRRYPEAQASTAPVEAGRISLPRFDLDRLQNPGVIRNMLDGALYPELARRAGIEGDVLVMFVTDRTGGISEAVVARGLGGGLDERALEIVRSMRFKQASYGGEPTELRSQVMVRFELDAS